MRGVCFGPRLTGHSSYAEEIARMTHESPFIERYVDRQMANESGLMDG